MRARRVFSVSLLAGIAGLTVIAHAGAQGLDPLLKARSQVQWRGVPRQVLAFYYGWYGNPPVSGSWVHWEKVDESAQIIGSSTHYPRLGPYDSHDPKVIEQHCRWAKEAGLTGFIVSWWAQGDFHDRGLPPLLEAAQKAGLNITVYFETVHANDASKDVLYLLEHYGRHPAWLKVNAKPVLFIYGRALGQIKAEGWLKVISEANQKFGGGAVFIGDQISEKAARVFDGIHTYNPTRSTTGKSAAEIRTWARTAYPAWVRAAGTDRIACVTVIPGYDDSKLGRPSPRPNTDRHGGETYRVLWEEAIAAGPDWVLLTSWNEWHEGSEIEPSVEHGDHALKSTQPFAAQFLSLKPRGSVSSNR
ncbi:MAG: glycoside hydrolase family 99-like domain-containing protein [Verrucomicrobia bacterium]|nr:glycoside hydrolase family 99-like domain-containing protein [Verrucomicrobiota bacterium]